MRIEAPHFVAGVDVHRGTVVHAAPILRYMMGWAGLQVVRYCEQKGWKWEVLDKLYEPPSEK
ncbi:MAG TPA: hypothetical protein VJS69_01180 [Candidatus Krumholzibacteria bacterium]|nr:hypothetical protein [Candidatus Krumholzibacteria bacterium]